MAFKIVSQFMWEHVKPRQDVLGFFSGTFSFSAHLVPGVSKSTIMLYVCSCSLVVDDLILDRIEIHLSTDDASVEVHCI